MSRFPRWVYGQGSEPDPRFSLANERTFLAWIRTALALFAAGVALEALALPADARWRTPAVLLFMLLGLLAAVRSWLGWAGTERALRHGSALPGAVLSTAVAGGTVLGVALVLIGLLR